MTISASDTQENTVDQIVTKAYKKAGLMPIEGSLDLEDASKGAHARSALNDVIDALATKGIFARSVKFHELTLVAGTFKYTLPANIIDPFGTAMYIAAGTVDLSKAPGESPVMQVQRDVWHETVGKDATGRPTIYYAHLELSQAQVWVNPVPDEAGTIRFQVHRLLADPNDGNSTPDLQRYWAQYLIYALAHELAVDSSMPVTDRRYLFEQAQLRLADCKAYSQQRGAETMQFEHPTPWSR